MRDLHESQLRAYQEAARAALHDLVHSVSLPTPTDDDYDEEEGEEIYVNRIVSSIPRPNWRVDDQVWEESWAAPLREKARIAFHAEQQHADDEGDDTPTNGVDDEEEDTEDGEITTTMEGEETTATMTTKPNNSTTTPAKKAIVKKRTIIPTKAGKTLSKTKALSKTALGQRANNRGRRARRGGRGGGAAK